VPNFELAPSPAYDLAPTISVVEGEVVIVGPGAVAFSMTRAAAEETYRRLGQVLKDSENTPPTPL
jgi:hypothetical protein